MARFRIREETIVLTRPDGETITGDLRYPDEQRQCPIVVIFHSFMAFKDWGFFPHLGRTIAQAGFTTFTFNFSWNGVRDSESRITDFPRFQQNTFSKELEDAAAVIAAVRSGAIGKGHTDGRIVLLGHSRGGGMAVLAAARHPEVQALITLAAIATVDRWTPHQKRVWREQGALPLSRGTSASPLRLGVGLLEDLEQYRSELSIEHAAGRIAVPWLILHGTVDVTVPPREAHALYAAADKSKAELVELEHVGHLFNAASPDEDGYATLNHTIEIITSWLHKHF